ncbi:MAG: tail fiber domain-containing protein [Xanthobacteraceae bacterium]|nr:tail fiber domain-containing protein [Xanthobacteraceae bacterium]
MRTALGGGALGALVVPDGWVRPVVRTIVVPAHAASSPATTAAPTTVAPTTTFIGPSDIRLKRDIAAVGRLANGLVLYRYRYLWSEQVYVGVMAQEVARIDRAAVVEGADGFLRVDYGRLGLRLMTWDEWDRQVSAAAA